MNNEMEDVTTADPILTVEELATRLRVKRSWVYTHADDLGAYHLGKYLRFSWTRVIRRLELGAGPAKLGRQPSDAS